MYKFSFIGSFIYYGFNIVGTFLYKDKMYQEKCFRIKKKIKRKNMQSFS